MPIFGRGKKPAPVGVVDDGSGSALAVIDPSEDGTSGDEASVPVAVKRPKREKTRKAVKEKVLPSAAVVAQIRRIDGGFIEDYRGTRYVVWEVRGGDVLDPQSIGGWSALLNNLEYPVQVLIRQHLPDYADIRGTLVASRPEAMNEGWIGNVCDSLQGYLQDLEENGQVVARRWYMVGREDRSTELGAALLQSGFDASRLDDEELGLLFQASLSGMGFGHEQDLYQMKVEASRIELNQRFASIYEVSEWPRTATPLFLERLFQSGIEMDISLYIRPVSPSESNTMLQMQRSRFEGSRLVSLQKGKLVHPEVEVAISDLTRIAEGVQRGVTRLYRRTMTVGVFGRNTTALRASQETLEGHFRASLARVRRLKYRQDQGLGRLMPTIKEGLGGAQLTDTDTLLRMFPFGPRDLDVREGTLLGTDLRSRTSVFFDGFAPHAMNGHMVVMARSGAGKSFFTKLRVLREASRGIPVYIIDPEGEYGVITRTLGGRVFVPGSKGYGLNPFVFQYNKDMTTAEVEDNLLRRVASLGSLVGVMLEGHVSQERKASIDHCLTEFYEQEFEENPGSEVVGIGGMLAFHKFLQSDRVANDGGKDLAQLLSPYATGSSRHLMQQSSLDLLHNESPVTSFNLKNLNSSLKPVATSVCAEVVWSLSVSSPRPRILIVDECWTVLSTPSGAEALLTIVKRARKYRLGLMAITQDVQDFLSENASLGLVAGHAGRSLLQNSALKVALQQDAAALPLVADALGLGPDMMEFLERALRGQGLLIGERSDCYPFQIVATPQEMELIDNQGWRSDGGGSLDDLEDEEPEPDPEVASGTPVAERGLAGRDLSERLRRRLVAERELDADLDQSAGVENVSQPEE